MLFNSRIYKMYVIKYKENPKYRILILQRSVDDHSASKFYLNSVFNCDSENRSSCRNSQSTNDSPILTQATSPVASCNFDWQTHCLNLLLNATSTLLINQSPLTKVALLSFRFPKAPLQSAEKQITRS